VYAVLAGGVGAARFLRGLVRAVPPDDITVIGNVGDDLRLHGLHVSPDLDTITYTLAGVVHPEQGWGRQEETFRVADELSRYGRPTWFTLGDRDLATHLARTGMLDDGATLSDATTVIARAWGLEITLLPATDDSVETRLRTTDGRDMHFQEYWVRDRAEHDVAEVYLSGAENAKPAPGVLDAIREAEAVLLCPSNPIVSIGTILEVPGVLEAADRPERELLAGEQEYGAWNGRLGARGLVKVSERAHLGARKLALKGSVGLFDTGDEAGNVVVRGDGFRRDLAGASHQGRDGWNC
jgi:LPPG:FO 2-phospho-L-lactate transferase